MGFIKMLFFLWNSSPLFSIPRSSSFSVIHISINIKNNAEKDTTFLLFFLSKSPGGHVISFQVKPWVAFGLPYLLIYYFTLVCLWCGRTVARLLGVRSRDFQIFSDGQITARGAPLWYLFTRRIKFGTCKVRRLNQASNFIIWVDPNRSWVRYMKSSTFELGQQTAEWISLPRTAVEALLTNPS